MLELQGRESACCAAVPAPESCTSNKLSSEAGAACQQVTLIVVSMYLLRVRYNVNSVDSVLCQPHYIPKGKPYCPNLNFRMIKLTEVWFGSGYQYLVTGPKKLHVGHCTICLAVLTLKNLKEMFYLFIYKQSDKERMRERGLFHSLIHSQMLTTCSLGWAMSELGGRNSAQGPSACICCPWGPRLKPDWGWGRTGLRYSSMACGCPRKWFTLLNHSLCLFFFL